MSLGISNMSGELASKRLEILKEVPLRCTVVMFNSEDPVTASQIRDTEVTPHGKSPLRLSSCGSQSADAPFAFAELTSWHADGLLWLAGAGGCIHSTIDCIGNL